MLFNSQGARVAYLTGSLLIGTIAMLLIIASLGFFINIGVGPWLFPVSFVLTAVLYFFINKRHFAVNGAYVKSLVICLAVMVVSVVIAINLYDVSYDGQSYHQEGIYHLQNGWNPFKKMLPDSVNMAIYINHYSKGVELPQGALYSLTNYIESSKATNFMILAGTFCLVLSYLLNLKRFPTFKSVLISFLAVFNPIAVNQLISTYVDGQQALMILCFFVVAVWLITNASAANLLLLGAIIVITSNIKFTGLVYMVIFTAALLAWLLFTKKLLVFKTAIYTAIAAAIVAVFMVGYNPYVINTVDYKHPFYPLMGGEKVDIIGYNLPNGFEGRSGANKFFTSLFAHTDNPTSGNGKVVQLKVPFTLNKTDVANASKIDTRIGGFGPLFSGILLLSLVVAVVLFLIPGDKKPYKNLLYLMVVIMLSAAIMPESWWARYIPQLWYLPVLILLFAELYAINKLIWAKWVLYAVIILNISFTFIGIAWNVMMTSLVNYQMAKLRQAKHPVTVQWGSAQANRFRFQENKVPYVEQNLDGAPNVENVIRSDSKFVIPEMKAEVPKSKFVQWAEKFQKAEEK